MEKTERGKEDFITKCIFVDGVATGEPRVVSFAYQNHRGELNHYVVSGPMVVEWKTTEFYPEPCWILTCNKQLWHDWDSRESGWVKREFRMRDMLQQNIFVS